MAAKYLFDFFFGISINKRTIPEKIGRDNLFFVTM